MNAWNLIYDAVQKGFVIGCDTFETMDPDGMNSLGLWMGHTYGMIGAFELKDVDENVVHRLLMIRDPFGKLYGYNGTWSNGSPAWTDDFKAQVPYSDANDGKFFIEDSEFVQYYRDFTVG